MIPLGTIEKNEQPPFWMEEGQGGEKRRDYQLLDAREKIRGDSWKEGQRAACGWAS